MNRGNVTRKPRPSLCVDCNPGMTEVDKLCRHSNVTQSEVATDECRAITQCAFEVVEQRRQFFGNSFLRHGFVTWLFEEQRHHHTLTENLQARNRRNSAVTILFKPQRLRIVGRSRWN